MRTRRGGPGRLVLGLRVVFGGGEGGGLGARGPVRLVGGTSFLLLRWWVWFVSRVFYSEGFGGEGGDGVMGAWRAKNHGMIDVLKPIPDEHGGDGGFQLVS